ncbi:TPA: 2-iminoacetate synthase ThiH [Candidatus Delongbacteria bacterium]|nr:MAG: thiamine biosynthesis protein ThiH [Candidatus Delongbacteria bacterium GWF2_40_14]HAQ61606.1 2-iminoacetate synthase ThiH [Candidatus Delongbacteria bacterium]
MSFSDVLKKYENFDFDNFFKNVSEEDAGSSLDKNKLSETDLLNLLSPAAESKLEKMAKRSHDMTVQYFGRTVSLYIPLYISNYCSNGCIYCGFCASNKISRKMLTLDEIEKEAEILKQTGIKHVLVLTGEAENITSFDYIRSTLILLAKSFPSISIEVFPMSVEQYSELKAIGVDGLTVYQEVYDRDIYAKVHPYGRKRDYEWRLECPERGAKAGFRLVNIGALYGLADVRKEAFINALHAKYLDDKYPDTEIAVSFPRINSSEGGYIPSHRLSDKTFVQFLTAFRLFLPRVGINVSTRENAEFRDNILTLGITRMSAGSNTAVGGYSDDSINNVPQFDISDSRNVTETIEMLKRSGYQPILKDWELIK